MPDLMHDYTAIRRRVGRYLGIKPNPAKWNDHQAELVDDVIRAGLAQYYNPPAIPPFTTSTYEWSFLKPVWRLDTQDDQREYALPDDFEYFVGPITHRSSSNCHYPPIQITSAQKLRELQGGHSYTSHPLWASISPVSDGGETEWVLTLHPTPGTAYKLEGQYYSAQRMLTNENPYPLGGATHSEGIMASCLAVAESELNDGSFSNGETFLKRLQANIFYDIKRGGQVLGKMSDGRGGVPASRGQARRMGLIHYNDLSYEAS